MTPSKRRKIQRERKDADRSPSMIERIRESAATTISICVKAADSAALQKRLVSARNSAGRTLALLFLFENDDVLPRQRLDRRHPFERLRGHFLAHLGFGHLVDF